MTDYENNIGGGSGNRENGPKKGFTSYTQVKDDCSNIKVVRGKKLVTLTFPVCTQSRKSNTENKQQKKS